MIAAETIDAVQQAVSSSDFSDAGIRAVKEQFPDVRLTYCLLDEMGTKEPYRECEGFSMYLVAESDHCINLTRDPEIAAGLLIAEDYF